MGRKPLIVHLGYDQTALEALRGWLDDHAERLAPHLRVYDLAPPPPPEIAPDADADPDAASDAGPGTGAAPAPAADPATGTDPDAGPDPDPDPAGEAPPVLRMDASALQAAAMDMARGRPGAAEALRSEAGRLAAAVATDPAPVACLTGACLLGPALGEGARGHVETEIYPRACQIIDLLAEAFAGLDTSFVVFERASDDWLRRLYAARLASGQFEGEFAAFMARFAPILHWADLRDELAFGLDGRAPLTAFTVEEMAASPAPAALAAVRMLNLPGEILADSAPLQGLSVGAADPMVPETLAGVRHPRHRALVLGGSNSVILNGWVNLLRRDYQEVADIVNLSMGSGSSAMGLYRLLAHRGRRPGEPLLWEYAANDYAHMEGGLALDSLLYHVEWVLQICIREERPFVPVLLRTWDQALADGDDAYVSALKDLFAAYGVAPLDGDRLLQILTRGPADLADWYGDRMHFMVRTEFPRRLAEAALLALDGARVPVAPPGRAAHFDPLELRLALPEEAPETFQGAGVRCAFAPFETGPRVPAGGRALAAILVAAVGGPAIRITAGDTRSGPYATQLAPVEKTPERQLGQLVLGTGAHGLEIPGAVVQIDVDDSEALPTVQPMYQPGDPPGTPVPGGLVALLCEAPRDDAA